MGKYSKYMNLCYDEMLKSNNVSIYSPKVGALLLFENNKYITSHRDISNKLKHAESILLSNLKESINEKCVLFITLEPCVAFESNSQMISCSELIVWNNIKTVYIGMIEPNVNIKRKGIRYLRKHKVSIKFFDKKITKKIKAQNRCFISYCKLMKNAK